MEPRSEIDADTGVPGSEHWNIAQVFETVLEEFYKIHDQSVAGRFADTVFRPDNTGIEDRVVALTRQMSDSRLEANVSRDELVEESRAMYEYAAQNRGFGVTLAPFSRRQILALCAPIVKELLAKHAAEVEAAAPSAVVTTATADGRVTESAPDKPAVPRAARSGSFSDSAREGRVAMGTTGIA